MIQTHQDPLLNNLLAALPEGDFQRWLPQLEWVSMPLGHVMYESGRTLSHVYFPTSAIVSLLYVMENGSSAEIAVVGREGVVGISLFMGGESTPSRAVVQKRYRDSGSPALTAMMGGAGNELIKRVPKAGNDAVCLAWTLQGKCRTGCERKSNHRQLSTAVTTVLHKFLDDCPLVTAAGP